MDREVINAKLDSLRRCVIRLKAKAPEDSATLISDIDLQDIISLNLSRAVQISVDIAAHLITSLDVPAPGTMGQAFDLLAEQDILSRHLAARLKKAVGFRNIAVHQYEAINWEIVHAILQGHLSEFTEFAQAVANRNVDADKA